MSRVENILLSMRQKPSPLSETESFVPVYNPQAYLVSKSLYDYNRIVNLKYPPEQTYELLEKASQNLQRIAELHARPENVYREPVYCPDIKKEPPVMDEHMKFLHDTYYSKNKMPPMDVYIEKLRLSGHSEKTLKKVEETFKKRQEEKSEIEKFIDTVFGEDKKQKMRNRDDQVDTV
jgi:hypothetical protein